MPLLLEWNSSCGILFLFRSGYFHKLAEGGARDKIPEMQKSLQGRISEHQQNMLNYQLGHIESLTALIVDLDAGIKKQNS